MPGPKGHHSTRWQGELVTVDTGQGRRTGDVGRDDVGRGLGAPRHVALFGHGSWSTGGAPAGSPRPRVHAERVLVVAEESIPRPRWVDDEGLVRGRSRPYGDSMGVGSYLGLVRRLG